MTENHICTIHVHNLESEIHGVEEKREDYSVEKVCGETSIDISKDEFDNK